MDLESMIFDLFKDIGYFSGGIIASNTAIYQIAKRKPNMLKDYVGRGELVAMQLEGEKTYLTKNAMDMIARAALIITGCYIFDFLFGINDDYINIHNAIAYGAGSFVYLGAIKSIIEAYKK